VPRAPEVLATLKLHGFGGSGGEIAINRRTGLVYVVHQVQVTILKEDKVVTALPTKGQNSEFIAVDEVSDWVYIVNGSSHNVTVLQGTQVITTVTTIGALPKAITVEPQSQLAYVVSGSRKDPVGVEGNVLVVKGAQVVGNLNVGRELLTHVIADPVSGYIYAGGVGGNIVVIKGLEQVAKIEQAKIGGVGASVKAMDVNRRTGEVYVLDVFGGLRRFKAGELSDTVKLEMGPNEAGFIQNVRVHPRTGDVYLVDWGKGEVRVLRAMKEIARVKAGKGALKMTIDPLTGNVYVANYDSGTVTVIHGTEVLANIKVGWYPYGIGVNPANGWVYVANINDSTVSVLGYR
jgi:YVTN family beta-propeller protein